MLTSISTNRYYDCSCAANQKHMNNETNCTNTFTKFIKKQILNKTICYSEFTYNKKTTNLGKPCSLEYVAPSCCKYVKEKAIELTDIYPEMITIEFLDWLDRPELYHKWITQKLFDEYITEFCKKSYILYSLGIYFPHIPGKLRFLKLFLDNKCKVTQEQFKNMVTTLDNNGSDGKLIQIPWINILVDEYDYAISLEDIKLLAYKNIKINNIHKFGYSISDDSLLLKMYMDS